MKQRAYCTPEIFEEVIECLKRGITVMQYVELNKDKQNFPLANTIYDYCYADSARKQTYTYAREMFADASVDATIGIADSTLDPQRANNQIKTRQWAASKIKPKVYGDKLDLDVTNKIDVSVAVIAARRRAQVIEHEPQSMITTSDIESEDKATVRENNPVIDPFS